MGRGKYLRYIASQLDGKKNPEVEILKGMLQNESLREVKRVARIVQEHKHDIQRLGPEEKSNLVSNMIGTVQKTKRPQNIPINIEIRCFGEAETLAIAGGRPEPTHKRETKYDGGFSRIDSYDGPATGPEY